MLLIANVLQPLIDLNEGILKFWHNTVGLSWGASIIGLTIVIRFAILPLTYRQVRSMQDMQRFSPEIQRIRERYKDDKQRQNEELMTLYKEHGFNPLGSCLPLVLQLPFFFGLYQTLRSSHFQAEVGDNGKFFFIPDITEPLKGHTAALIVMLLLYVGSQLASSYVSSLNVQDKNQRRLLFIFPFVFVPVVINFEAGLLIYWVTTNVFTVSQQLAIRRFLPPKEAAPIGGPAAAKAADGGDGAKPERASRKRAPAGAKSGGDGAAASSEKPARKKEKAPAASSGQGNGGPRKPPPRSPRKKKKRTGRRR